MSVMDNNGFCTISVIAYLAHRAEFYFSLYFNVAICAVILLNLRPPVIPSQIL